MESRPVPGRRTVLDALRQPHLAGDSLPVGHYGLSQGGETALRPVAEESRTRAAVPDGA